MIVYIGFVVWNRIEFIECLAPPDGLTLERATRIAQDRNFQAAQKERGFQELSSGTS